MVGVDPSDRLLAYARRRATGLAIPVELITERAEAMPPEVGSVDTVVVTYALCTIAGPEEALQGTRRALKPGGQLLFCEHGLASDYGVRRWQQRIAPLWLRLSGGCRLTCDAPALLEAGGFRIDRLDAFYLPHTPCVAVYHTIGSASPR